MANHLGDARMLRSGGLLDQPLRWFAVQHAGWQWSVIKTISAQKKVDIASLSKSELELYWKIIDIRQNKRGG